MIRRDEADAESAAHWRGVRDGLRRAAKSLPSRLVAASVARLGAGEGTAARELENAFERELTAGFASL